jgi:hypothetical protein
MTTRPRVTAECSINPEDISTHEGTRRIAPGVTVHVDFDLHDHEAALSYLAHAVSEVRAQIEESARD